MSKPLEESKIIIFRVVGIFNFFLGVVQIVYPLGMIFVTIPRLSSLYSEFEAERPSLVGTYFVLGLVMLAGLINFFLGTRLFSKSPETREKYFKYALILVAVSFLLAGMFSYMAVLSAVIPIYNLTSQL